MSVRQSTTLQCSSTAVVGSKVQQYVVSVVVLPERTCRLYQVYNNSTPKVGLHFSTIVAHVGPSPMSYYYWVDTSDCWRL